MTPVRLKLPGEAIKTTSIVSNIDFEFTQRIYNIHYYTFLDMLSNIGGLRASLEPIFGLFLPVFTAYFMYSFAGVVERKIADNRRAKMAQLIKCAKQKFAQILKAE